MPRPRITYANVTATLALVLALGGTSYAVSKLPPNSVGAPQLKRGAVSADKVQAGAIGREKLAPDALVSGPRGPRGPEGVPGSTGARGPSEAFVTRNNSGIGIPFGSTTTVGELSLPPGAYALDFAAHTFLTSGATWVDCKFDADGTQLTKTAVLVGTDPSATIEAAISLTEASTFTSAVRVRVLCSERAETAVQMTDARLRAVRVASVSVQ